MDNDILFEERQKFKQWWLWLMQNKKKLLIGTSKPDQLIETLNKIGQIKE